MHAYGNCHSCYTNCTAPQTLLNMRGKNKYLMLKEMKTKNVQYACCTGAIGEITETFSV